MSTSRKDTEFDILRDKILGLQDARITLLRERIVLDYDDPRVIIIQSEMAELNSQLEELLDQLQKFGKRYRRPDGLVTGLFSKTLGPLPIDMERIHHDDEHVQTIVKSLPSYRMTAFAMLIMVVGSLVALSNLFPVLLVSPFSLFMSAVSVGQEGQSGIMMIIVLILSALALFMLVFKRSSFKKFIFHSALEEEMWFRSGAENWTYKQRIVSCVAFGGCHVINLIYPMVTLLVLSMGGAVFMAVYLREYRRSQDVERATLASAKLHAVYNGYALIFMVCFIVLAVTATFIL